MPLWGLKETKTLTGTVAVTEDSTTVTGTSTLFTTECKAGDSIRINSVNYVIAAIASATSLTLETPATGDATGQTATVSEKPKWLSTDERVGVYAVDLTEAVVEANAVGLAHPGWVKVSNGTGYIASITVANAGSGYATAPTATISAGAGEATTTISSTTGKVTAITVTVPGVYSVTAPTVTIAAPAAHTFNTGTAVNGTTEVITLTGHKFVTGDPVTYSRNSGVVDIGPEPGTFYVNKVDANSIMLYDTAENAVTGGATGKQNLSSSGSETHHLTGVTATGTVVMGGRFGRVRKETLVAMGVAAADMVDAEDSAFPDS